MVFDQGDNEIPRDHTNDFPCHVYHWNGGEFHLGNLTESLNCADTLKDFDLLMQLVQ